MTKLVIHGSFLLIAFSTSALAQEALAAEEEQPEATAVPVGKPSLIGRGEKATLFARGELVLGQTVHGIAQSSFLCTLGICDFRLFAGTAFLGALLGGVGAFLLTGNGISAGPAEAINCGTAWGIVEGFIALSLVSPAGSGWALMLSLSALAGTGVGLGAGLFLHPSSGQVAMVNSGAMWLGLLVLGFSSPFWMDPTWNGIVITELITTGLGMVGLSVLASYYDISLGRIYLINAGGVVGGLLGGLALLFLPPVDPRATGSIVAAGALLGLGVVGFFSQGLDAPKTAPKVSLTPMVPKGGGFGLMAGTVF